MRVEVLDEVEKNTLRDGRIIAKQVCYALLPGDKYPVKVYVSLWDDPPLTPGMYDVDLSSNVAVDQYGNLSARLGLRCFEGQQPVKPSEVKAN